MHLVWSLCVVCLKSTPRKHTIRLRWSNEGMSRKSPNLILGPFWLNLKGQKRSHVPLPCSYKFLHGWNFAKPHRYAKMHTILDIDLFSNIEAISNFNPPPPPPTNPNLQPYYKHPSTPNRLSKQIGWSLSSKKKNMLASTLDQGQMSISEKRNIKPVPKVQNPLFSLLWNCEDSLLSLCAVSSQSRAPISRSFLHV